MGIVLASLHGVLPKIFSSDSKVINYASSLLPIMAIFQFFDGNCVRMMRRNANYM
jgi:Na+-driven multidrug efflux pump